MRREDIIAFAEAKERYWARQKASMTPTEALRFGDALRADVEARRPGRPSDERDADLATHERVSEMLRRVGTRRSR